jgi:hypothetical protein
MAEKVHNGRTQYRWVWGFLLLGMPALFLLVGALGVAAVTSLKGTPEERRQQKAARRQNNRAGHVVARANAARGGHQLVVVACNAALAASKRINNEARKRLANAIARLVEEHDTAPNRKERP